MMLRLVAILLFLAANMPQGIAQKAQPTECTIRAVIEIPAGTLQKWEINKKTGIIEHQRMNADSLRMINYLPYPANYGFVPNTLMSKSEGGDGDPLDIFVIGEAVERGTEIECRPIAIIKLTDNNERDDKVIAVALDSPLRSVRNLHDLRTKYKGIIEILSLWLQHYDTDSVHILSIEDYTFPPKEM